MLIAVMAEVFLLKSKIRLNLKDSELLIVHRLNLSKGKGGRIRDSFDKMYSNFCYILLKIFSS